MVQPQQYKNAEELERSFETKAHSEKSVNVSDMTVSDEDGYLSRSKMFNSNNKIVKEGIGITVKLTIQNRVAKVDVEPNATSCERLDMEPKNPSYSLKVNEFADFYNQRDVPD